MRTATLACFTLLLAACTQPLAEQAFDAGEPPACVGPSSPQLGWQDDGPPFFAVMTPMGFEFADGGASLTVELRTGHVLQPAYLAAPTSDPRCETIATAPGHNVDGRGPSAGPVTLANDAGVLVATPSDAGNGMSIYAPVSAGTTLALTPGASLWVNAAGDRVPPFHLSNVVPTPPIAFIANAPSDGGRVPLHSDGGLVVSWTGASCGDQIIVSIVSRGVDTLSEVRCLVPAGAGVFTFPTELVDVDPARGASMRLFALRQVSTDAGVWPVVWEATVPALGLDGGLFGAQL